MKKILKKLKNIKLPKAKKERDLPNTFSTKIATCFGVGFSPWAPGTMGSLCALPIAYIIMKMGGGAWILTTVFVFLIGWLATYRVLKNSTNKDPGAVVIDEIAGQLMTFGLIVPSDMNWLTLITGFALFRFFDIAKVWPASYYDVYVKNAFGVMMDDIVAGVQAAIILTLINLYIF